MSARKTLGQLRDEQIAQAYEDGRKAERESILARARRMNYGPTLRRFCRDRTGSGAAVAAVSCTCTEQITSALRTVRSDCGK